MELPGHRVHHSLEERDEDEDEDRVEGLHLVRLDHHAAQLPIHTHSLQSPARTLGGGGVGGDGGGGRGCSPAETHVTGSNAHLLVEESPEDWQRQEHDQHSQHQPNILNEHALHIVAMGSMLAYTHI